MFLHRLRSHSIRRRNWKIVQRLESLSSSSPGQHNNKKYNNKRKNRKRKQDIPSLMDQFPGMSQSVTQELEALKTQRKYRKSTGRRAPKRTNRHNTSQNLKIPQDPTELANRKIQGEINGMPRTDKTRTAAGVLDVYKNNFALSLTEGGLKPNIKTINLMLSALHHSSDIRDSSRAMYFWGEMKKNELEPNSATYSEMIKNLTRLGVISTAFEFYNERESKGLPSSPNDPHILLRACARIGEFDRADDFIEKYMTDIGDRSNYVLSNMVNSLLELADGATYHGHMDRLRRYNTRLVQFASMCPESENVVKWRPILNVVMRSLVLAVQYDDVDAALDMLKLKSKIPEKGLRHNGLFSIFMDENNEDKESDVDESTNKERGEDNKLSAPPPLQLERDIVRSLLYVAARNGSSALAENALSMYSEYEYEISSNDARAYLQAKIAPYRSGERDLVVEDLEKIVLEVRDLSFEFNTKAIDDVAKCFPCVYAIDKFFYELTSLNESRKKSSSQVIPAELPCSIIRASYLFEDAERVLETIQDWNNICGEPIRKEALVCVLNCTAILEKEAAENIYESGMYSKACGVAGERMEMCVSECMNLISENNMEICEVIGSALMEAYVRMETVGRTVSQNIDDCDSMERLVKLLSEMRTKNQEFDSGSLRMLLARAEDMRWNQILEHPTVSEFKLKACSDSKLDGF